jgi:hypothetical protein
MPGTSVAHERGEALFKVVRRFKWSFRCLRSAISSAPAHRLQFTLERFRRRIGGRYRRRRSGRRRWARFVRAPAPDAHSAVAGAVIGGTRKAAPCRHAAICWRHQNRRSTFRARQERRVPKATEDVSRPEFTCPNGGRTRFLRNASGSRMSTGTPPRWANIAAAMA